MIKLRIRILLSIILIPLFYLPVKAINFSKLSVSNGLGCYEINASLKDKTGYLWFVTRIGIVKYDGDNLTHYPLLISNRNSYEYPKGIIQNKKGELFSHSERHILKYDEKSDEWNVDSKFKIEEQERILSIASLNNELWVGTNIGLYRYNKEGITKKSNKKCAVLCITPYHKKTLWLATNHGIMIAKIKDEKSFTISIVAALKKLRRERIQTLWWDKKEKKLWIGTFTHGLKVYSPKTHTLINAPKLTKKYPIRTISEINDSTVWVGVDGEGIFGLSRKTCKQMSHYSTKSHQLNRLSSDGIYHILNTPRQVWISTYTAGVMRYNKKSFVTHYYKHKERNEQSLKNNYINTFIEGQKNEYWIGTNDGISIYESNTNKWKHLLKSSNSEHKIILALHKDSEENIWAGGYATDLYKISKNKKIETIHIPREKRYNRHKNYIYSICSDNQNKIWIGGIIDGLTCYDLKTKKFKFYKLMGINKIYNYSADKLLIASIRGLILFDKKTGKQKIISTIPHKDKSKKHIVQPNTYSLCVDQRDKNIIWTGTEGRGVIKINLQTKSIASFTVTNGLSSNRVCGIIQDKQNRIWVSTQHGLNCINDSLNIIDEFYTLDGLPYDNFNYRAVGSNSNKEFFFGTKEGLIQIDPELHTHNTKPFFNLRFKNLYLDYNKINDDTPNSPLKGALDKTESIKLSYDQRSFSFEFININFEHSNRSRYSWKLEGFEDQFSTLSKNHKAVYTNIPPGSYTFIVRASKNSNSQKYAQRSIKVIVSSPWWQSYWAYAIYFIIIIAFVYLAFSLYIDKIQAKSSDEKIKFFVNIAHDIRTPLTLVKAPLNEMEKSELSEKDSYTLSLAIQNTNKLIRIVNQLLNFQKVERNAMTLNVQKTNLKEFIENNILNYKLLAKNKDITLETNLFKLPETGYIDKQKIEIILDNILSNAIKYTRKGGKIQIYSTYQKGNLEIEVNDNGIGISKQDQKNLFKRFYRAENATNSTQTGSGIGLMLTKKLILLHKGDIQIKSNYEKGTTCILTIPIESSSFEKEEISTIDDSENKNIITEEVIKEDSILEVNSTDKDKNLKKILIVEDNESLRTFLSHALSNDYQTITAENGNKALIRVQHEFPDFIISDVVMPEMDGLEFCKHIKENMETCHIPVVLLTALNEKEDFVEGLEAGADDYIAKPFDITILKEKIKSIIKNRTLYRKKYIDKTLIEEHQNKVQQENDEFVIKSIELIEQNLQNDKFTVDLLASEMAMSRSVYYKKLKSLTNQTPQELIKDVKMKYAAELLRKREMKISEISDMIGFPNAKYFSTVFKKYYGVTPSQFISQEERDE